MRLHHIDNLLKETSLGKRIIFEQHLREWQNKINLENNQKKISTQTSIQIVDITNLNDKQSEVIHVDGYQKDLFLNKISLSSILESTLEGRGLLKLRNIDAKLSDANERILCDKITDYYIQHEINMQASDYIHMTNQIVLYFPSEVKVKYSYYNKNVQVNIFCTVLSF